MEEITCEYFDGINAIPSNGKLFIESQGLRYISENELSEEMILFKQIQSVEKVGISYNIKIKTQNAGISPLIVVKDLSSFLEVFNHWKASKTNPFSRFFDLFLKLSLPVKVVSSILCVGLFVALFLFALGWIHTLIPTSMDEKIGSYVSTKIIEKKEECTNQELRAFLGKSVSILNKPGNNWNFKIHILNDNEINAISLPGGYIFLYSGLIEDSNSPEEVVGVLAHEMSHIEQRHGIRQLVRVVGISFLISSFIGLGADTFETMETFSEVFNTIVLLKYSRNFEKEADLGAIQKLNNAKIATTGFIEFFQKFDNLTSYLSWISSHPADSDRINFIKENTSKEKKLSTIFQNERDNWEQIKMGCQHD
ncbi:MAG: M48 family metallopeptidase [Leptospiraceae bacterium]|nr:M48 family metallopeptidase [Leptospiraceae bacterium]MCP5495710.1 M48 family metallopeptidase [Leptospiraceae bacterium]